MPAGTIEHHDDMFVAMALGYLIEKDLHAIRVDVRQNQGVEHTTLSTAAYA